MTINNSFQITIHNNSQSFSITERMGPFQDEASALSTLRLIEYVIRKELKYCPATTQIPSDLDQVLLGELKHKAKWIRDSYCENDAEVISLFKRLFGLGKQSREIQLTYNRIENLASKPPFFKLYNNAFQHMASFVPAKDLRALAQMSRLREGYTTDAEVIRANNYGYKGQDLAEAKDYLNRLFKAFRILIKESYIPRKDLIYEGFWPFSRHLDLERTLRNLKYEGSKKEKDFKENLKKALLLYASKGELDIVNALLFLGADTNALDKELRTPLALAAMKGKKNVVERLIEAGADVNTVNLRGNTPLLHSSNGSGYPEITRLLLENGAADMIDQLNNGGNSVLHSAAERGNVEIVNLLIEYGANLDIQNQRGATALTFAASQNKKDVVEALVKAKAQVNINTIDGNTPLISATLKHNCPEIAALLLDNGVSIDHANHQGNTALHIAAERGHLELVNLLIDYKADLNVRDPNQRTPLALAILRGRKDVVEALIKAGADVNTTSIQGNTPITHATFRSGFPEIMRLLLEKDKSMIDHINNRGFTALLFAARSNQTEVVELLLKYGADPTIQNLQGKTALQLAKNAKVKQLLKQKRQ